MTSMSHPSHLHQQRATELIAWKESKIYQIPRSHYPKQEDLRVAQYRRRERTLAVTENVLVPSLKHTAMNSLAIKNKIRGSERLFGGGHCAEARGVWC